MDTASVIIFTVIMLHLLIGMGYLMYKLSPRKKEDQKKT